MTTKKNSQRILSCLFLLIDYEKSYNRATLVTNCDVFLSLNDVLNLANRTDSDEMQHYAAFHLGLTICQSIHFGISYMQRVKRTGS